MAADKVAALAEHLEVRTLLTALGAARKLRLPTVVKDCAFMLVAKGGKVWCLIA